MPAAPRSGSSILLFFAALILTGLASCTGGGGSGGSVGTPAPTPVPNPTPPSAPPAQPEPVPSGVHTWWHDDHELNATTPVADNAVRRSTFYDVRVVQAGDPAAASNSFVYMTIPRSGRTQLGYSYEDGAEFAAAADLSMSWSTFLYDTDVWVEIDLRGGQSIQSIDEVTIRPTTLALQKEMIDGDTIRIRVPFSPRGHRFSVELDAQAMTSYSDHENVSGTLSEDSTGLAIHREPRNSLIIFAEPIWTAAQRAQLLPDVASASIYYPPRGTVNLTNVTASIVYFMPGVYYMPSNYHAHLPSSVIWVYVAAGAYVKGAFQFRNAGAAYKVTGHGVISGEKYVYQADRDTSGGHSAYDSRLASRPDCHASCVKMLEFDSAPASQTLLINGVTVNEPPYHSFAVYGDLTSFPTTVANYKQVGGWYWQTDGMEIYRGGSLADSFFHANDDVLKMYHGDTAVDGVVVWKGENGPVIQLGWTPRNIENVAIRNVEVIHNRMYWKDQKHNTCIINSAKHYLDANAGNTADVGTTIRNVTMSGIRSEGMNLCAMRMYALSNWESIRIDGLEIEAWNELSVDSQLSHLTALTTSATPPQAVVVTPGSGLQIENYSVAGQPVRKSDESWRATSVGRLAFDSALDASWSATATLPSTCVAQSIDFPALGEKPRGSVFSLAPSASSGLPVMLSRSGGTADATLAGDTVTVAADDSPYGSITILATQAGDATYCPVAVARAFDVNPRWVGASWRSFSPGDIPLQWDSAENLYRATVELTAGNHQLKFTNTSNWSGEDWGGVTGLSGTAVVTTGRGDQNLSFTIVSAGSYVIRFNPSTLAYSITLQ